MNEAILRNAQCSICLETLGPPIRMLPCGHNFCQSCLMELPSSFQQIECPNCRRRIPLGSDGVTSFARNHDLESVIENLEKVNLITPKENCPTIVLSGSALKQLKILAASSMKNGSYNEAIQTLQTIIVNDKSCNKILSMIDKVKCLIALGKITTATDASTELVPLIECKMASNEMNSIQDECSDGIVSLIKKFTECKQIYTMISLLNCQLKLVKKYHKGKSRLLKLQSVGSLMMNMTREMREESQRHQVKQLYKLFDEIFDEMQAINDVNLTVKCVQVVWVLHYYGYACIRAKDNSKSETIYKQAKAMMELVFAGEAAKYRVFGTCYNNLGWSYENTNKLLEAKHCYRKAVEMYEQATDYESEDEKQQDIELSSKNLERVNESTA